MDPYVYDQSNVLKNRLNIQDEQELIDIEAQLLIAGILDLDSIFTELNFFHLSSLKQIHHHLFHIIYEWAGEFRTVNIYKDELHLGIPSVSYSDYKDIQSDLNAIFSWAAAIDWNYSNTDLAFSFTKLMTAIWRVHPYREGNTRTVSIFMKLFADAHDLNFNEQILSQNAGYLRNALVLAAVQEMPEPKYLLKMIHDALGLLESMQLPDSKKTKEKYKVIGKYKVANYEEKPFTTNPKLNDRK